MKRWIPGFTALVIAATLLLGGCTEVPAGNNGQSGLRSHGITASQNVETDSITYLKVLKEFIPVSLIKDGEQRITGDVLPIHSPETIFGLSSAPKADTLSEIDIQAMYTDQTVAPSHRGYTSDNVMETLASDGEWDFFPVKVTYEKYTLSTQPQRSEWTDYFQSKLDAASVDAPLIFTEAWLFDWNGTGCHSVIVNVGNLFLNDCEDFIAPLEIPDTPNPPPSENAAVYIMSSMFIYEEKCDGTLETVYDFLNEILKVPTDSVSPYSYIPPVEEIEIEPRTPYYAIQQQADQNWLITPVYIGHLGEKTMDEYVYNNVYALSDIDGNGQAELLAYKPAPMTNAVYIYQSDQDVPKQTTAVIFR